MTTHTTVVTQDFLDHYIPSCSCGWIKEWATHNTRVKALGEADRHKAEAMDRRST